MKDKSFGCGLDGVAFILQKNDTSQLLSFHLDSLYAWRVKRVIHPINSVRSMPSSVIALGAIGSINTAPQGLKGKVYCPLVLGQGAAILHNTSYIHPALNPCVSTPLKIAQGLYNLYYVNIA